MAQGVECQGTVVIYESPYRTSDTVRMIQELAGPETKVVVERWPREWSRHF